MPPFKIKIWGHHEITTIVEGEPVIIPKPGDDGWKKFNYFIETDEVRIKAFEETVIFEGEDVCPCMRIYFSDGSEVLGRYSTEAWLNRYSGTYLPMIPKTLSEIVEDLKKEP